MRREDEGEALAALMSSARHLLALPPEVAVTAGSFRDPDGRHLGWAVTIATPRAVRIVAHEAWALVAVDALLVLLLAGSA